MKPDNFKRYNRLFKNVKVKSATGRKERKRCLSGYTPKSVREVRSPKIKFYFRQPHLIIYYR